LRRGAIAQYEATVILVIVSLSLASVVYEGLKPETRVNPAAVFFNQGTWLGGDPVVERLSMNSSTPVTVSSLEVGSLSSQTGVLAYGGGGGYSVSPALCRPGQTTFFSVLATGPGSIDVTTDGRAWIAGSWADSATVSSSGLQEVMIADGTTCSVSLPGGQSIAGGAWSPVSSLVSSIPLQGSSATGQEFLMFIPTAGGGGTQVLLTTSGGFDALSI
jgi:hypothetical protein